MNSQKAAHLPVIGGESRPKQAAQRIGCSIGYVYALIHDGQLDSRTIKRRGKERGIRLISNASIERFLTQGAAV